MPVEATKQLSGCDAVRQAASKYDWDVSVIVAVSQAESGCTASAKGDTTLTYEQNGRVYGYSVSVMQVRILPGREHCDVYDLDINMQCAYNIYKGQGYEAWTMYTNGKYLQFM